MQYTVGIPDSNNRQRGFTIVELLIVILVIGMLAALVITSFRNIQEKARDTARKHNLQTLHEKLEVYYTLNTSYPSLAQLNDLAWVSTNMEGLDKETLRDPKSTGYTLAAAPTANQYAYAATASDGTTACDNTTVTCAQYVLTATLETGGTFVKKSLN